MFESQMNCISFVRNEDCEIPSMRIFKNGVEMKFEKKLLVLVDNEWMYVSAITRDSVNVTNHNKEALSGDYLPLVQASLGHRLNFKAT